MRSLVTRQLYPNGVDFWVASGPALWGFRWRNTHLEPLKDTCFFEKHV